jgi:hypothetical protein
MKKYLLLSLVIVLFLSCKQNSNTNAYNVGDTTSISFVDSVFDFGKIIQGETVTYTFKFKNTGDKPLVITEVHTSCGCTVPTYSDKPITPGSEGYIKATFNSAGKSGDQYKVITVNTNTKPDKHELVVKGTIAE